MEFHELQQITESNSRAIQSLTDAIVEDREQAREERQELRQAMIGIANLVSSLDSDRPTILSKLNKIENKVDQLLERGDQKDENH